MLTYLLYTGSETGQTYRLWRKLSRYYHDWCQTWSYQAQTSTFDVSVTRWRAGHDIGSVVSIMPDLHDCCQMECFIRNPLLDAGRLVVV